MSDLREPPVPADCDLAGFRFMPLDVDRLLDSDFIAITSGDDFKAAVILWCKAWKQVPAASIPDDDRVLARWVGVSVDAWKEIRSRVLHGFELCSDGRLYHSTIAAEALTAWAERLEYKEKRGADRDRLKAWREAKRAKNSGETRFNGVSKRDGNADETSKTGTGTGTKKKIAPHMPPKGGDAPPHSFQAELEASAPVQRGRALLPDSWQARDAERQLALGELHMTAGELADAEAEFREWAGSRGRKPAKGASPNWDLTFRNHLRTYAKRIGSIWRRERGAVAAFKAAPTPAPVDESALPAGPKWWRDTAALVAQTDPAAWRSYGPTFEPLAIDGDRFAVTSSAVAQERMARIFDRIGSPVISRLQAKGAAR